MCKTRQHYQILSTTEDLISKKRDKEYRVHNKLDLIKNKMIMKMRMKKVKMKIEMLFSYILIF